MNSAPSAAPLDPLTTLREYRALAPWGLRDLAALAGGILDASGVVPVNAAARARPSERTIRFYVARGLVSPPDGRGTAAVYSYRHLLQVLAIKLRQMEGATLESMAKEFAGMTGDLIERRAASALGPGLPPPDQLPLLRTPGTGRGRVGRAVMAWLAPVEGLSTTSSICRRIPITPGVEVLIDEQHPALRLNGDPAVIAEALRQTLASLVGLDATPAPAPELQSASASSWSESRPESEMFHESALETERPG
ncbi:MAG TPA: MerR family transcriptional regulator [Gemmatimonadales bacterium]|nr:MerR family transcriptional regulator [Gemmatimonadales bacterium]